MKQWCEGNPLKGYRDCTVRFPVGTWYPKDTLEISDCDNVRFIGAGRNETHFDFSNIGGVGIDINKRPIVPEELFRI